MQSGDDQATVLEQTMSALLPAGAACVARAVGGEEWLTPAEQRLATGMTPSRRREFSAGRACARVALARVGCLDAELPVGPGRAPVWPGPWVGSISHTGALAVAVASRALGGIGIDIEDAAPLEADLVARVCRPEEHSMLAGQEQPERMAKVVFSAKESVYKCLWPRSHRFIEFHELSIDLRDGHAFGAAGHGLGSLPVTGIQGRWATVAGLVVTVAWLALAHCNRG